MVWRSYNWDHMTGRRGYQAETSRGLIFVMVVVHQTWISVPHGAAESYKEAHSWH